MGFFRFRRRIQLLPGIHLNVGKTGLSLSAGIPGAQVTVGHTGTRTTLGIPGTGLFYTDLDSKARTPTSYSELTGQPQAVPPPLPDSFAPKLKLTAENIANLFPDAPEILCVFLFIGEATCGPYSWFQVLVMLADNTITLDHLFFNPAKNDWEPLRSLDLQDMVSEFQSVMAFS